MKVGLTKKGGIGMYRKVNLKDIVFDIIYKRMTIDVEGWQSVEKLVRGMFITRFTSDEMDVTMIVNRDMNILRFLFRWELEKRGRDVKVHIEGNEYVFRRCRVYDINIDDLREDAMSLTVSFKHSGILVER